MSRIENDIRETKNDMRKENAGWQSRTTDQINKEAERIQICTGRLDHTDSKLNSLKEKLSECPTVPYNVNTGQPGDSVLGALRCHNNNGSMTSNHNETGSYKCYSARLIWK
jgi:hypothetical protein